MIGKELKQRLENDIGNGVCCDAQVLVVAVRLPSGAIETIVNYQQVHEKCLYYKDAYDEHFQLKTNPMVRVVGYMLA